ncbi:gliding motility-associated C-terminal domain-containing protein [Microvirga sp. STR05]|uniref:Gliding motility-associated C-terminal domain-containing protein n=1 Tax=Hymenobacter duratus TaxID=2771356 RepID=A0ABR8JHD9_9BACT|nr:gliding motility-associated C-terminal domain-containing protein [Hymenobacter duratus]MBD2713964.1 gliding motility-associated C-terminal domain-containing protein [Hymenobacter duratus]MBR7948866.1 gliding motility-associated C-terminal domain-containing protein [Microvirga sp. STR05]
MQKLLRATYLLVTALCLTFFGMHSAEASHFQGGQLTYESLGNNRYRLILRVFRDCSGADLYTTARFVCRPTGCATTGPLVQTYTVPLKGGSTIGSPYCATAPGGTSPCDAGLPTNYETGRYDTVVTLNPAAEWRISVEDNARPDLANINGNTNIYYEATLNNLANGQTIQNNSAQFDLLNVPVPFVCWKQQTTLNFTATDIDGDELVYSLDRPLVSCNNPNTYNSIGAGTGGVIVLPPENGQPCVAILPTALGSYSPTFPIASFSVTGNCPAKTAVPDFRFNASNGSFTFTPYLYTPGTTTAQQAQNKYVVVGKVSEYRVINGVRTLIGSVRRDILVVVIDCSNAIPGAPVATGNNTNSGVSIVNSVDSTFIEASTCNYTRVLVRFTDPNPADLLTVTFPPLDPGVPGQPTYLPTDVGTFRVIGQGTRNPIGIFDIQPDVLFTNQTFRIPVQIRDNGCPIIGQQTRIIVLSVKQRNPAKVVAATAQPFVCAGTPVNLTATPTRPDSVLVNINTPSVTGKLATYTYQWSAANGLATADQNKQNVTVRPTQTTRYYVRINATDFRQSPVPTCVDTTSILVRVAPPVTANFTATGRPGFNLDGISSKESVPPRIFSFVNTSKGNNPSPADTASVTSRWTYQRTADANGNPVTETAQVFSNRFTPRDLTLREGGTYVFTLRLSNRAGSTECTPSLKTQEVKVPNLVIPNVFTPNKDGKNDVFVLTTEETGSKVQIFNRWGRLIKEYANYQNNWDGGEQPAGVYYYLLTDKSGKTTKGWVELAR